jgi:SAM-dependent methyltransferase
VTDIDPTVLEFYEQGREDFRLFDPVRHSGPLEFARTQELILRYLSESSSQVLDIGGGPGAYSRWLIELGHEVRLFDPVELHVEQARAKGVPAEIGDARAVAATTESADAVLLLGPLYHLVDQSDRLQAWSEARRVLRKGGLIFAAALSRFAPFLDLVVRLDHFGEEAVSSVVEKSLKSGNFGDSSIGLFTTSYLHRPAELRAEAEAAGFRDVEIFNIEGPGFILNNFEERWTDPARRESLLSAIRLIEQDEDILGLASHLLVVGRRSD